jgi:type I restriction enzyme S subunit
MSDLPKGWAQVALSDVVEVNPRRSFDLEPDDMVTFVPMAAVSEISGAIVNGVSRPLREVAEGFTQFADGDVIFAKITPSMENGKSAIATDLENGIGFGSTEFHVLRGHGGVMPEYIWHFIRQSSFRDGARKVMTGAVGQQRVPADYLKTHLLPLPPLTEQKRIVAKLNNLISGAAYARDALDRIPALIEKYKTRILALSFNGGLIGKKERETILPESRCWNLPTDWRWVKFKEVATVSASLVRPESILDLPHIAPNNIQSGTAKLLPYRTIGEDGVLSAKQRFYPGQILYSKIRPYLRKAVLVDFDGACSADMYPINVGPELEAKFLLYWLISADFAQFSALHEERTVLPKINKKELNSTPLPLPPKEQQIEIVRRIETALAWLDRVSDEYTAASKRLPQLDASILQAAFRGELIPQNPHDEPASMLLERIEAEKEAKQVKTKTERKVAVGSQKPMKRGARMANLIEVLKAKGDWVSASKAAQALGIGNGATSDAVEGFYNEMRMHLQNGDIEVERRGDEDWLRLMPISEG